MATRHTGLAQRQEIVDEAGEDDESAAHAEQGQAEWLEDQNQGKEAEPDDAVFHMGRRLDRHAFAAGFRARS